MEDMSRWEVAGSASFASIACQGGSDIITRLCPAMPGSGARRPKSQRHQKGFNHTQKKTADLSNVNCHLTPPTITTTNSTTTVPPGSSSRSGVESELNQGFSCYKSPSAPAGERRQADRKQKPPNGTGSLFSREPKPDCCSSTNCLGGKLKNGWRGER